MGLFRKAIRGNEEILIQELDVDSSLWEQLRAREVLTEYHLANCLSEVS